METTVQFAPIAEQMLERYIASGEHYKSAGAFAEHRHSERGGRRTGPRRPQNERERLDYFCAHVYGLGAHIKPAMVHHITHTGMYFHSTNGVTGIWPPSPIVAVHPGCQDAAHSLPIELRAVDKVVRHHISEHGPCQLLTHREGA